MTRSILKADTLTLLLAFIEGFALILSPCILPIVPIFVAGSLTGSKRRPLGIVAGFALFFTLIVFFSRQFVQYTGIELNHLREWSFALLCLLGLIMLVPSLSNKFQQWTQRLSNFGSISSFYHPNSGFLNGLFFGGLIAIIWTPCAGPILATIILQTVTQKTTALSFITLLSFATGAAIPMMVIALYGNKIIHTFAFFKKHTLLVRQALGAIIIASVFYMIYLEEKFVSISVAETGIKTSTSLINGLWVPYSAPPIVGIDAWINSPPLQLTALKGHVVLVDFWTYSCINCLRTLPYLKLWYNRYHAQGLEIIGVHTPEFGFEKKLDNVKAAVERYGIHYPVGLDNQFKTWNSFDNHYWPAHYLINKQGQVVYKQLGEGDYGVIENNIRFLLGIDQQMPRNEANQAFLARPLTPETYLGYARADTQLSPVLIKNKINFYQFKNTLSANAWDLNGEWLIESDHITSKSANASLRIQFHAKQVFMVMGSPQPIEIHITLDGKPLIRNKGVNVENSHITVNQFKLYHVVSAKQLTRGVLEISTPAAGVEIYTFTFG